MKIDDIKAYIVIVNGGSGCIFKPEDETYNYVLTAKHNLVNENNQVEMKELTRFEFLEGQWFSKTVDLFAEGDCFFLHPEKDIAIIKIATIKGLDKIRRYDDFEDERTGFALCGYPATRRRYPEPYRIDENVSILGTNRNQLREGQIPGNPTIDEIRGHSGGAIVKIKDKELFLAGIQNKMVSADNEYLGRIEFSVLKSFDEIVNLFPDALSPLYPPHCKSFKSLKEQVMKLEGCFGSINFTKIYLQGFTDDIINDPLTPDVIRNHFHKRLLIYNEKESSLYNEGLWIAWLELLIILKVIGKNPMSEQDLDEVFNQYRIIYSSSKEDWSSFILDVLRSDYKGLKDNACIIVSNEKKPVKCMIGKGLLHDISRQITTREMNIDEGEYLPVENLKHIHLYAFQQNCIVDKEEEYTRFDRTNEKELYKKLKQEYENFINND